MHNAVEGTVVVAEVQTNAYGRLGRDWISPLGGLWFSIILRPRLDPKHFPLLTYLASLAVAEVLDEFCDLAVQTKWPNDVIVNDKKICGVLVEARISRDSSYVIVGVGVNVNFDKRRFPTDVRRTATTVKSETGRVTALEELLALILQRLEQEYFSCVNTGFEGCLEKWKNHAKFLGRRIIVAEDDVQTEGIARDVDIHGALVLRLDDGSIRRFFTGELTSWL